MSSPNLLNSLSSSFLKVRQAGIGGWSPNKPLKSAPTVLAQANGGTNTKAYKGSVNILPAPYNQEFVVMTKAFSAVRAAFYEMTLPFGNIGTAEGSKKADGDRLVAAQLLANGKFTLTLDQLTAELDSARAACAATMAQRVYEIQRDNAVNVDGVFDPAWYPDSAAILAGWRYEPIVPQPLADGSRLSGMYLPAHMVLAIEGQMEAQAAQQLRFGQQSLVEDTIANIQTMAANLTKLDKWFTSQEGRRPSIYDSLVDNLKANITKLRTYALPETDQGVALLALADEIETSLDLPSMTAEDFKTDHLTTRRTARTAETLAKAITEKTAAIFDLPKVTEEDLDEMGFCYA